MFSWYYLYLSEKNEIGNVCLEARACPYGSCREVGHTVLLSGEAISLRMVLPLSEKYHRRNFRFYTVLKKKFSVHHSRITSPSQSPFPSGRGFEMGRVMKEQLVGPYEADYTMRKRMYHDSLFQKP